MRKKRKLFKILAIISLVLNIVILGLSLYLHISEIIAMNECASTPGCMYCVPAKSIVAMFGYFISFLLTVNTVVFFILYKKVR